MLSGSRYSEMSEKLPLLLLHYRGFYKVSHGFQASLLVMRLASYYDRITNISARVSLLCGVRHF